MTIAAIVAAVVLGCAALFFVRQANARMMKQRQAYRDQAAKEKAALKAAK